MNEESVAASIRGNFSDIAHNIADFRTWTPARRIIYAKCNGPTENFPQKSLENFFSRSTLKGLCCATPISVIRE